VGLTREEVDDHEDLERSETEPSGREIVALAMRVRTRRPISLLITTLAAIDGVVHVGVPDEDALH
jgi:hypothetical protein